VSQGAAPAHTGQAGRRALWHRLPLLPGFWTWLRYLGREKPRFYYGEDQIAITINGQSWSSESGEPFPEGPGWDEFREDSTAE
jgi:hypothetical protein